MVQVASGSILNSVTLLMLNEFPVIANQYWGKTYVDLPCVVLVVVYKKENMKIVGTNWLQCKFCETNKGPVMLQQSCSC